MRNEFPYDPSKVDAAYSLRYVWTGWLSEGVEQIWPSSLSAEIKPRWEADGMRCLESVRLKEVVRIIFSTKPQVSPTLLATRCKGRLDHELRRQGIPHNFSRKLSVRSIGENTREDVQNYISTQVENAGFVDSKFQELLKEFTVDFPDNVLGNATPVSSGRYWYDLHVVLVTSTRFRFTDYDSLKLILDQSIQVAKTKNHLLSRCAVMPDHLHLLLRGDIGRSPSEIVGDFQNGIAQAFSGRRIWKDTYYVGSVGPYNMNFVRRN